MDFEKLNLQPAVGGETENKTEKEPLSVDYQNIRNEALAMIDLKIALLRDELGEKAPEIVAYETAKEGLADDQFILNAAKVNNWQKRRDEAEDLVEEDKKLAQGLISSAMRLN